ncbi:hypothetical protein ALC56_09974 [Trachymyrmex septentrionalis]|uniref:Uncharacterized protein n=1 Tax=Trachymyrmex septentrionalis TaxID=34720 RepID=A0A151JU14_9HYME|nr:hypothetical protein ALC56_09974 [Trachymyrmex septentrionalis]
MHQKTNYEDSTKTKHRWEIDVLENVLHSSDSSGLSSSTSISTGRAVSRLCSLIMCFGSSVSCCSCCWLLVIGFSRVVCSCWSSSSVTVVGSTAERDHAEFVRRTHLRTLSQLRLQQQLPDTSRSRSQQRQRVVECTWQR